MSKGFHTGVSDQLMPSRVVASQAAASNVCVALVSGRRSKCSRPTRPSSRTCRVGVKAAAEPELLAATGVLQVLPPSSERETAIASRSPPEKRLSCHASQRLPSGAAAAAGMIAPSRMMAPVVGSRAPIPR